MGSSCLTFGKPLSDCDRQVRLNCLTMPRFSAAWAQDDYDPRNSDFIRPATDEEVVGAEVDLKRKQIAKLQTLVARLDAKREPDRRTSYYQEALELLQHECQCLRMRQRRLSRDSWGSASTAMPSRETSSPGSESSLLGNADELYMGAIFTEEELYGVVAEE